MPVISALCLPFLCPVICVTGELLQFTVVYIHTLVHHPRTRVAVISFFSTRWSLPLMCLQRSSLYTMVG